MAWRSIGDLAVSVLRRAGIKAGSELRARVAVAEEGSLSAGKDHGCDGGMGARSGSPRIPSERGGTLVDDGMEHHERRTVKLVTAGLASPTVRVVPVAVFEFILCVEIPAGGPVVSTTPTQITAHAIMCVIVGHAAFRSITGTSMRARNSSRASGPVLFHRAMRAAT